MIVIKVCHYAARSLPRRAQAIGVAAYQSRSVDADEEIQGHPGFLLPARYRPPIKFASCRVRQAD